MEQVAPGWGLGFELEILSPPCCTCAKGHFYIRVRVWVSHSYNMSHIDAAASSVAVSVCVAAFAPPSLPPGSGHSAIWHGLAAAHAGIDRLCKAAG